MEAPSILILDGDFGRSHTEVVTKHSPRACVNSLGFTLFTADSDFIYLLKQLKQSFYPRAGGGAGGEQGSQVT